MDRKRCYESRITTISYVLVDRPISMFSMIWHLRYKSYNNRPKNSAGHCKNTRMRLWYVGYLNVTNKRMHTDRTNCVFAKCIQAHIYILHTIFRFVSIYFTLKKYKLSVRGNFSGAVQAGTDDWINVDKKKTIQQEVGGRRKRASRQRGREQEEEIKRTRLWKEYMKLNKSEQTRYNSSSMGTQTRCVMARTGDMNS